MATLSIIQLFSSDFQLGFYSTAVPLSPLSPHGASPADFGFILLLHLFNLSHQRSYICLFQ